MLLLGVGAGVSFPALMTLGMSGATPSDSGLASGILNTTAQVGAALGLAVLATLAASRTDGLLSNGESMASALTGGYRLAFGIGAGLGIAGMVTAVIGRRRRAAAQLGPVVASELPSAERDRSEAA